MAALTIKKSLALAARFRGLRPDAHSNAERRVWADMVNAVTASGAVPEPTVRDFRQTAGWDRRQDAPAHADG